MLHLESNNKQRTPNLRRHAKISKHLQDSLANFGSYSWVDTSIVNPAGKTYNMVDLFCGCGGLSQGYREANFSTLFAADIDSAACATYRYNLTEATVLEMDMEDLDAKLLKELIGEREIHVLCAGFPCPGFSIAGLKDPDDPRNILYKQVVRIAKVIRPWFVQMENVPRLVRVKTYLSDIMSAFEECGYKMSALILESAKYGVPQIRPRTIFIGNRLGLKNPYPRPLLDEAHFVSIEEAIGDLVTAPRDPRTNHEWTRHSEGMTKRIAEIRPGGSLYESYVDAWKRQYRGVPSMTVKENHGGNHVHYELNRVLSAREMARLQSFPDNFIFWGNMKRALFQVGNAVPPLLARHIALAIRSSLDKVSEGQAGVASQ